MASAPAAPGPWRLIGVALLWLLLVEVGGGEAGLLGAYFVTGLLHGGTPAQGVAALEQPGFVVTALSIAFCTQLIMLLAARLQGRRLGRHVPAGLGGGPIRRRRVVAALFALQLASTVGVVFLVHRLPEIWAAAETLVPFVTETTSVALAPVLAGVFLILLLAPLAEELFFRGWLWLAMDRPAAAMGSVGHGASDRWSLAFAASWQWLVEAPVHLAECDLVFASPALWRQRPGFALAARRDKRLGAAAAGHRALAELSRAPGHAHNAPPSV